ncbi:MAG: hypothetical protein OXU20_19345 [Myxococcales bacterium]|nr:hypothetical protein [Myxococcales bacterium]MDD9971781.1 hypothetical protein [Myxococcales bacterium]
MPEYNDLADGAGQALATGASNAEPATTSTVGLWFGLGNIVVATILLWAVFGGLPTRWYVVDVPAVLLGTLWLVSGGALLVRLPISLVLLRVSAMAGLVVGLLAVAVLSLSAAYLSGTLGNLGRGGALTLTLVIALAVPYFLLYPSVQLLWVHARSSRAHRPGT